MKTMPSVQCDMSTDYYLCELFKIFASSSFVNGLGKLPPVPACGMNDQGFRPSAAVDGISAFLLFTNKSKVLVIIKDYRVYKLYTELYSQFFC
jgi:hypothetical protein